jgi:hypothetical protein
VNTQKFDVVNLKFSSYQIREKKRKKDGDGFGNGQLDSGKRKGKLGF